MAMLNHQRVYIFVYLYIIIYIYIYISILFSFFDCLNSSYWWTMIVANPMKWLVWSLYIPCFGNQCEIFISLMSLLYSYYDCCTPHFSLLYFFLPILHLVSHNIHIPLYLNYITTISHCIIIVSIPRYIMHSLYAYPHVSLVSPTLPPFPRQVLVIEASHSAFCALRLDGSVVTWGDPAAGGETCGDVQRQLKEVGHGWTVGDGEIVGIYCIWLVVTGTLFNSG